MDCGGGIGCTYVCVHGMILSTSIVCVRPTHQPNPLPPPTLTNQSPNPPTHNPNFKKTQKKTQVAWLLEEGPADADGETLTDAVEQFGVEEDAASRILEAEFKSAARQVCRGGVWLDDVGGGFMLCCGMYVVG